MATTPKSTSLQPRNISLDVFRGMTICFMIIVNTPGNSDTTFSPLLHAKWNGFTPTDLVFPSFLFAVGNAKSFVMHKWGNMKQIRSGVENFKAYGANFFIGLSNVLVSFFWTR